MDLNSVFLLPLSEQSTAAEAVESATVTGAVHGFLRNLK
jgi:hypothetical protein